MLPMQGGVKHAAARAGDCPVPAKGGDAACLTSWSQRAARMCRPYHRKQSGGSWHAQDAALWRPPALPPGEFMADRCSMGIHAIYHRPAGRGLSDDKEEGGKGVRRVDDSQMRGRWTAPQRSISTGEH